MRSALFLRENSDILTLILFVYITRSQTYISLLSHIYFTEELR